MRTAIRRLSRATTQFFGKRTVQPASDAPSEIISGRTLAERMFISGVELSTLDEQSEEILAIQHKAASVLGRDCRMRVATLNTISGKQVVVGISKGEGIAETLLGVYELNTEMDGVLFRRVCDRPVQEMCKASIMPEAWPRKYKPVNTFGGNRKLPSRTSVRDIFSST